MKVEEKAVNPGWDYEGVVCGAFPSLAGFDYDEDSYSLDTWLLRTTLAETCLVDTVVCSMYCAAFAFFVFTAAPLLPIVMC